MKRKLLSIAIAIAMLSQVAVFAGPLTATVGGSAVEKAITTELTSTPSSTESQTFDYKVAIDMSAVKTAFNEYYTAAQTIFASDLAAFNASTVTGEFTVTFRYPNGVSAASALTAAGIDAKLPSVYKTKSVTSTDTQTTIVVEVKAPATVNDLNTNTAYFNDFSITWDDVTVSYIRSDIYASMSGYVDITEADNSKFAHLTFTSNETKDIVYNESSSSSGGGYSGGGSGVWGSSSSGSTSTPVATGGTTGGSSAGYPSGSGNSTGYVAGSGSAGAETEIILTIGHVEASVWGQIKTNDVAPVIRNDRTMIPIRFVAEALSAKVDWDEATRTVTITSAEGLVITIGIDEAFATVNGATFALDSPSFIQNDRTYLPVRFVSETLGATVGWDEATQQVIITK